MAIEYLLALNRGNVGEWLQEAVVVEPPDPLEGGELHIFQPSPGTSLPDHLRLEEPDHRLRQRIVVAVPSASDRRLDAHLRERSLMVQALGSPGDSCKRRLYGQRWKAETLVSVAKRKWGEALSARSEATQKTQALLRGLIYNLYRLSLLQVRSA